MPAASTKRGLACDAPLQAQVQAQTQGNGAGRGAAGQAGGRDQGGDGGCAADCDGLEHERRDVTDLAELLAGRADAAAVFDAAAAERGELERAAVAVRLRQRGVEIVDALPEDLAPRLADTYLALKAAGRL